MLVLAVLTLVPTPIGIGPAFHPRPAAHGACMAAPLHRSPRVHLELFAHGRVVIIPAAIGLRRPRVVLGRVTRASCRARVWTTDPTGVVSFERGATLADLFEVWGRALSPARMLGFRGNVRVYVDGRRRVVDARGVRMRDGAEIVLEVGQVIPPHRSYRFPLR